MNSRDFTEEIIYQWHKKWSSENLQRAIENCKKDSIILPYILKYLPKNGIILEAGCGLGQWVVYLSGLGYNIVGVEIVPYCIEICKTYFPNVDIRVGDVRNLPFPDAYFDGYISIGVIEHMIEGPESTLKEMWRVLKPGGIAILTVPSFNYFLRIWYPFRRIFVEFFKYNNLVRKILGKPLYYYDKEKTKSKLRKIKKHLRAGFWPIIGTDVVIGPFFIEYKYKRGQLDNFLRLFNFEIIESVPIYHPLIFHDVFGDIFCKKNSPGTKENDLKTNLIGKVLNKIFCWLSPHIFNYVYLYVVRAKK